MTKTTSLLCLPIVICAALAMFTVNTTGQAQDQTDSVAAASTGSAMQDDRLVRIVPQSDEVTRREAADAVRRKLRQHIEINLREVPLSVFLASLEQALGSPVYLDELELSLADIDPETTILKGSFSGVRLDVALLNLLPQYQCGYYIDGGLLVISSREKADTQLYTCVYDCRDLLNAELKYYNATRPQQATKAEDTDAETTDEGFVSMTEPQSSDRPLGPAASYTLKPGTEHLANVAVALEDALVHVVTSATGTTGANGWLDEGTGAGTLSFLAGNLVVAQTEEAHREIEELLHMLRQALAQRPQNERPQD